MRKAANWLAVGCTYYAVFNGICMGLLFWFGAVFGVFSPYWHETYLFSCLLHFVAGIAGMYFFGWLAGEEASI